MTHRPSPIPSPSTTRKTLRLSGPSPLNQIASERLRLATALCLAVPLYRCTARTTVGSTVSRAIRLPSLSAGSAADLFTTPQHESPKVPPRRGRYWFPAASESHFDAYFRIRHRSTRVPRLTHGVPDKRLAKDAGMWGVRGTSEGRCASATRALGQEKSVPRCYPGDRYVEVVGLDDFAAATRWWRPPRNNAKKWGCQPLIAAGTPSGLHRGGNASWLGRSRRRGYDVGVAVHPRLTAFSASLEHMAHTVCN